MQEFVKVNEELADRSAAYLAMWKALEAFDPKVDRWSECAGSAGTGERALRVSVDAALRAGIFKASGSFDPMGLSVGTRSWFPRP